MKALRKVAVLGASAGLVVSGLMLATPASADPVAGGYAAVGSDTLEASMNALTNGTTVTGSNVRVYGAGAAIGNFDAFGSATIVAKSGGPVMVRPSGSGAGVNSLISSIRGAAAQWNGVTITGQVDIARSSSSNTANANGNLLYVPYARDAVSYAYDCNGCSSSDEAVLSTLTKAELAQVYSASGSSVIRGVTINPRLPQSASGTRQFFLAALGLGKTYLSPAVPSGDNTTAGPQENDATVLSSSAPTNEIIPFSVANWIAQSNKVAPSTMVSTVKLGTPVSGEAPYTGTGTNLVANPAFYSDATFGRDTYLVVEYARVNPASATYDADLATLVDPAGGTASLVSYGTSKTQPGAVKTKFGFLAPSTSTPFRAVTW